MNTFPHIYKVKQSFDREIVANIESEVEKAVKDAVVNSQLPKGARIAVTAGSRGIQNIVSILKETVSQLKKRGYSPFLVAGMGSHGRGTKEGQHDILASLGITESSVGAPVSCSEKALEIGRTTSNQQAISGLPVFMADEAFHADGILVVNRIKPHTSSRGDYESGLLKMLAVGLGREKGATSVHSLGAENMAEVIPAIARVSLEKAPVLGGIAIVENAYDETAIVKGVAAENMFAEEKRLQKKAKSMMPSLPITEADLCLIGEIGKNFSGTGMDTNIVGRMRIQGIPEPDVPFMKYLGVLGLSEESHGNANGIGLADFTTKAVEEKIDREATYLNCLTSGFVIRCAIPMVFQNDRDLVQGAAKALKVKDPNQMRMIYIKNTLDLEEVWVSEVICKEIKDQPSIEAVEGPFPMYFNEEGNIQFH